MLASRFRRYGFPAEAAGDCTVTAAEAALDAEEKAFLTLINNYRVANGRQPLKISYYLTRPSAWKSKHLGTNAYFAHDDTPIGRTWSTSCHATVATPTTPASARTSPPATPPPPTVFAGWQGSPGHNSNMLGSGYTAIGIGRHYVAGSPYGWYWTTVFGGVDDGWYNAPETVTAVSGDIEPLDWAPPGYDASSIYLWSPLPPPAPRGGSGPPPLASTFSGICETLRRRRHPLAPSFASAREPDISSQSGFRAVASPTSCKG